MSTLYLVIPWPRAKCHKHKMCIFMIYLYLYYIKYISMLCKIHSMISPIFKYFTENANPMTVETAFSSSNNLIIVVLNLISQTNIYIYSYCAIYQLRDCAGSKNPLLGRARTSLPYSTNIMAADVLPTQGAN